MQNSGPWDPWLPVVEYSRLFAQRVHSACTAHGAPPLGDISCTNVTTDHPPNWVCGLLIQPHYTHCMRTVPATPP